MKSISKIGVVAVVIIAAFSMPDIEQKQEKDTYNKGEINQELIEQIECPSRGPQNLQGLPQTLSPQEGVVSIFATQEPPVQDDFRDWFPWKPIKPRPDPIIDPNPTDPPRDPLIPRPIFPQPTPPDNVDGYINWFWKFYANRPLLGKAALGAVILGLLYAFYQISQFIKITTGTKDWLALIVKEPVELILGVWVMIMETWNKLKNKDT